MDHFCEKCNGDICADCGGCECPGNEPSCADPPRLRQRRRQRTMEIGESHSMIRETTGDILEADVEALVNPVNTVGVMGAGLAAQFKRKYPEMFREYRAACQPDWTMGTMLVHWASYEPRLLIINFPTKAHWRDRSKLEWIDTGLADLRLIIQTAAIESIAIPALGCGLGGLAWADVRGLIVERLGGLDGVDVVLYVPETKGK